MARERKTPKFTETFTEVVYLETDRDVTDEEIKDTCEANDIPVPEHGTNAYYEMVNDAHETDVDDFRLNLNCQMKHHGAIGKVIACNCFNSRYPEFYGSGVREGYAVKEINDADDLIGINSSNDEVKIYLNADGLFVSGYHHDGHNTTEIRILTKKGEAYVETHTDGKGLKHAFETKGYSSKVKKFLF